MVVEPLAPGTFGDRRLRLLLLAVLIPYYGTGLASHALYHYDEALWIRAGARTASLVFVERDLRSPAWHIGTTASMVAMDHPTATATNRTPKLAQLLIGLSIAWLDAPRPRRGEAPARVTVLAGRLPAVVLSLVAALWFFQILRLQMGPGFAFAGALLLATCPLVSAFGRRAMLDGPAFALSIGAILWTIRACREPQRWPPVLLAALLACAALSSKLNAGLLLPVLALAFGIEAWRRRSPLLMVRVGVAGVLALAGFVALNPTLYDAPLEGVLSMLRVGREVASLGERFDEVALPTLGSRIGAAYQILLVKQGIFASRLSLPVDGLLAAVGTGILVVRARREEAARVLLLWLAVALLAVCVWPPVRWPRYFLPAMAPLAAAESLALGAGLPALARRVERWLPGRNEAAE